MRNPCTGDCRPEATLYFNLSLALAGRGLGSWMKLLCPLPFCDKDQVGISPPRHLSR